LSSPVLVRHPSDAVWLLPLSVRDVVCPFVCHPVAKRRGSAVAVGLAVAVALALALAVAVALALALALAVILSEAKDPEALYPHYRSNLSTTSSSRCLFRKDLLRNHRPKRKQLK
jgi:hypothetical protein